MGRIKAGLAALLFLATTAEARLKTPNLPKIEACMTPVAPMLHLGLPEATQILAAAGFDLQWHSYKDCPPGAIQVILERELTYKHTAEAIGWSFPSEGVHVGIALGIIESVGLDTGRHLLACAIAHEIGHLLEGTTSHSAGGLMKATWTTFDLDSIRNLQMRFDPPDVDLMQKGYPAWSARTGSAAGR